MVTQQKEVYYRLVILQLHIAHKTNAIWQCLVPFGPVLPHLTRGLTRLDPVWPGLAGLCPVWPSYARFGPVIPGLTQLCLVWYRLAAVGHV